MTNDTAALVERNCEECGGSGVAETIAGFDRPCDVCHGSGAIKWTQTEAVLLDQVEAQDATITALQARVAELEDRLKFMAETPLLDDEYQDIARATLGDAICT